MNGAAPVEHENARIVRGVFEAMARGDREAMAAAFAEEVVWHSPGTSRFSGRFEGKVAVLDRIARLAHAGLQTRFDVHDVVANDEHAVALVHLHLEDAGGRRYDQQQVQVMHLREGLIVEYWAMNEYQAVLDLLMGD
jgi:ketosteroid isomerase-like protein